MKGIIGAMEKEVIMLRDLLENPGTVNVGAFVFHTGKLEGSEVVILQCGIGKVNAAVGCAVMIQSFRPEFIVNTGSAGGIAAGLRFGDVIISDGLLYHDVDVTAFGYLPGQLPGQPRIFPADPKLADAAEKAFAELKREAVLPADLNRQRGLIASGDTFMHRSEDIEKLRRLFPDVAAVEMEGAAIAHCCAMFSLPFLVIRALSDIAGAQSPVTFDEFLPVAAKHSAEIVRRIVRRN